jgi:xylulokinase
MTLTLGLDIGTFESKAVLADETGRILGQAATPHEMRVPRPGWAEHDAERDWWGDTVTLIHRLLDETGRQPDAVALSAIGPCLQAVDRDGAPLGPAILYGVDTRATAEIAELNAAIGPDTILARCGNALTSQSIGPKILWLARTHPDLFARAARLHSSTSFLVERLTGAFVLDHYTAASFSPLYDVARQGWSFDLAPGLCRPDQLPRLMWSAEIAGHVTPEAAAATGLAAGTPVTCGTIDAAAEAVSVGTRGAGDLMLMYGSTVFVIQITAARVQDPRLWYAPWLAPGAHAAMAGLATSGTLTHWFRDRFARDLPREDAFGTLTAEAESVPPGANGLLFLPYFSGERTPLHDPLARGAWFGLTLAHGRGDLYRALLEGIANATAHVLETYAEAGAAPARLLAVGGGTRNRVWLQSTSDISGLPQIVPERTIGASYGNAFLAAQALGAVAPADIDRWNPAAETVEPRAHPVLARQHRLFRALYEQTRAIAHQLGQEP